MAKLSRSSLVRQAEIFITNGARPEAQTVIADVGYGPTALTNGQTLVSAVKTGQAQTKELLAAQKSTTRAEKNARTAAQKEVTSLSETARLLFANDNPTLALVPITE